MRKFLWKIGGEAGFGIMVSGLTFSKIAAKSGYHVFDYPEYPSLIRGGHNTYEVVISDEDAGASKWDVDMLVCLNKDTYDLHKHRLTSTSLVLYDPEDFEVTDTVVKIHLPLKKWRKDFEIMQMMTNTIALGASLGLLGADMNILYAMLEKEFRKKGEEVIEFNKELAQTGFDFVKKQYKEYVVGILSLKHEKDKLVMSGNEAFSLATVIADCRFFSAYPMTPSSNVLTELASWQTKTGMIVRHAEDEISVINEALGASNAGVRASVATSGGGFSLMVEAVSFAGVAELPVVIFLGQRPGPATGMPTWTEQGDLLFVTQAGHGEFPKIVLAPGDIMELIELTVEAYDLADIYQTPVVVLADKLICESHKSHPRDEIVTFAANHEINRGKLIKEFFSGKYLRYQLTEDGVSGRLIPGKKGYFYQTNSYEHLEDSHTTEDAVYRRQQVEKRNQKTVTYLQNHFRKPKIYGDLHSAEIVFVSWGGNKGIILEAQKNLSTKGYSTAFMHFTHVYPLAEEVAALFQEKKRYILIENNSHGQFGQLLRMQTGVHLTEKVLKYDGRPFYPDEIINYVTKQ